MRLFNNDHCVYIDNEELKCISSDPSNTGNIKILQLNIWGITSKQSDLGRLLQQGAMNKVDVALLCETWLRTETKNSISIPRYSFESLERKGKKGGGVEILISEHRKYRRVEVSCSHLTTIKTIAVELKCDRQNILLASCYRSPNSCATQFVNEFMTLIEVLQK